MSLLGHRSYVAIPHYDIKGPLSPSLQARARVEARRRGGRPMIPGTLRWLLFPLFLGISCRAPSVVVRVYTYTCTCVHTIFVAYMLYRCVYTYTFMCIYITYKYATIHIYIYIHTYVCIYIHTHLLTCVYAYICKYTHIHVLLRSLF